MPAPTVRAKPEIFISTKFFAGPFDPKFTSFLTLLRAVLLQLNYDVNVWPTEARCTVWTFEVDTTLKSELKHLTNNVFIAYEAGGFDYNKGLKKLVCAGILSEDCL